MSFRLTTPSLCERKSVCVNLNEVSDVKPGLLCVPSNTGCKPISNILSSPSATHPFSFLNRWSDCFSLPTTTEETEPFVLLPAAYHLFFQTTLTWGNTFSSEAFEPQTFFFLVNSPASHRENVLPKGRVWVCLAVASSETFFQTIRLSFTAKTQNLSKSFFFSLSSF